MTTKVKEMIEEMPELGLSEKQQNGVVKVLSVVLADAHILYLKLRKYHWNVHGPQFFQLHELFEQQYTALAATIDEIAERIVQYGAAAPGTMEEFLNDARLSEEPGIVPDTPKMVANIVSDHEAVIRALRDDIKKVGEDYDDVGAEDFLTQLLQDHQKFAWMARAMLQGKSL